MFEKEAEEYLKKDGTKAESILNMLNEISPLKITLKQVPFVLAMMQQVFKDGAEFGYNKANEWHDLRKNPNNLPKECENVLCFCYGASVEYYSVGHFIKSHSDLIWWSNNGSSKLLNVIAWCELPRFEGQ